MKLIKTKSFWLSLLSLAIPMALQDLIKNGLNLVDNIMVGKASEIYLAAINLANQPFFLFSIIISGLASGGSILISQYHGKEDFNAINKIISITLAIALFFSLIFTFGIFLFPEFVMQIFTSEIELILNGKRYLKIIGWTYLLFGISNAILLILRSLKLMKMTLYINIISFLINVILDYGLIFGKLGFPRMEIEGAALATFISRLFEMAAMVIYIFICDKRIKLKIRDMFALDKILLKDYFKYGVPVVINELIWGIGIIAFSVILGRLGTQTVAASSVSSAVEQFVTVAITGIANAAAILIGNEIGAGKKEYAKQMSETLLFFSIIFGVVLGLIFFVLRIPMVDFYNLAPQTKKLAMNFMAITSFLVLTDSISVIAINGILRGGGDTKFVMWLDILAIWLVSLPLSILFAFVLRAPLELIFFALRADVVVKVIVCFFRLKNNKWITNVTRNEI